MSLVLLGWTLAAWPAVALGQEGAPLPPVTAPPRVVLLSPGAAQELLERLFPTLPGFASLQVVQSSDEAFERPATTG